VVVVEIDGVKMDAPVDITEPPVLVVYHCTVPALGVTAITTVPVPMREPGVDEVTDGIEFTVTVTLAVLLHVPLLPVTV
jgi:hypothetical protein